MVGMSGQLFIHNMKGVAHESVFPDRFILEQFTGLHDKNGREIYEGDIVAYSDEDDVIPNCKGEVNQDESGSWLVGFNSLYTMEDAEIIGNIHENPELL